MKIWIERLRSSKGEQGAAVSGLRVSCLILDSVDRSVRMLEMGFVAGQWLILEQLEAEYAR